jgi:hypothetical protein
VFVERLDGHMALANGAALRAAGITRDTPDVPGGTIVRDASGEPTGIFKDNALSLVERAIPPMSNEMADRALDAAMDYVAAQGVTSVQSMGSWDDLATYRRAHDAGRLRTRIYAVVPLATWQRLRDEVPHVKRPPSEYLREHFWVSTQPMEETDKPDELIDVMEWIGFDRLLFASDYPHWDFDDPFLSLPPSLSDARRRAIYADNARALYRLA